MQLTSPSCQLHHNFVNTYFIECLRDYTIRPGHAIEGHAYAKYKKGADSIEITLPIGDKKYVFNWDTTSLVNITEDL